MTESLPAAARPRILVDGDACPVKDEIYKVAWRVGVPVLVVANAWLRIPDHELLSFELVGGGFDEADDRIVALVAEGTHRELVVTADIELADRSLKAGAGAVLAPTGKPFTEANIGSAMATRAIMADLRADGSQLGGPPPFSARDRSTFLQALDREVMRLGRT
ncbi:hypothetical protein B5C34_14990 [Pacificimonas flava]|uniref:UPF0178 protein B5C34_14990 n=2 Tax=Pacificimonas TaxID=1960290 RepID=A0A219B0Y8_9SPHN|nr:MULTISPECIES: YaiI/YqxD family protein [Pacificimonas]MBZ6379731.1 YaiI/YqxD family protein [Pacificimonas aurantium]OWV31813.1 hypothetical protein B5C34_14990 [Pacificimonas flava]